VVSVERAAAVTLEAREIAVVRGGRRVLDGVSLELRRGEVAALIGPNGAGKSTLVAILAGLAQPDEGRVERRGRVAAALQTPALARRSASANVEAALAWWGVARSERPARAAAALASLQALELGERPARDLSGGEARRVHLARALAVEPDTLLLDEPFAGLDPSTRADLLYDAASAIREAAARATLIVVHDRAEAWALADRVLVLIDGRVLADGSPAAILRTPPTREVARFVGFAGELVEGDGSALLLRPEDVALAPDGPLAARVLRRVPVEDGVRLELETARGRLLAVAEPPGPEPGDDVRVALRGGIRYGPDGRLL
jgi:ABC-type sulfate/molybdate transport systems ATPase subunit